MTDLYAHLPIDVAWRTDEDVCHMPDGTTP